MQSTSNKTRLHYYQSGGREVPAPSKLYSASWWISKGVPYVSSPAIGFTGALPPPDMISRPSTPNTSNQDEHNGNPCSVRLHQGLLCNSVEQSLAPPSRRILATMGRFRHRQLAAGVSYRPLPQQYMQPPVESQNSSELSASSPTAADNRAMRLCDLYTSSSMPLQLTTSSHQHNCRSGSGT